MSESERLVDAIAAGLADDFAKWAAGVDGLLARSTEESVRDLADAYYAGYGRGQEVMRKGRGR